MVIELIEKQLGEIVGLNHQSVSRHSMVSTLKNRKKALGLADDKAYLEYLKGHPDEVREYIEAVVIPETWFFRDHEPFLFLQSMVRPNGRLARTKHLNILSIPCSTGEEPFSIAVALLAAGLRTGDFRIDAMDISRRALEKAKEAVYAKTSFREKTPEWDAYFEKADGGHRPIAEIRHVVRFHEGNLLQPDDLAGHAPYDIIFCRNLLIYLHEEARVKAIRALHHVLAPGGVLFLGYAESRQLFFPDYLPVSHPRSYAAIKPDRRPAPISKHAPKPRKNTATVPATTRLSPKQEPAPSPKQPATKELLQQARTMADRGRLAQAARICDEVLRTDVTCTEAYYLSAVIALAEGEEERALQMLNKTLYLDPDHVEALTQAGLLLERQGLLEQAGRYKKRRERLLKPSLEHA